MDKQVAYWRDGSVDDMEAAEVLLEKHKLHHALFFAHLALEKILKAHVARATNEVPPKIHNLLRLAQIAGLGLPSARSDFLARFEVFQIEGRYPRKLGARLRREDAARRVEEAKEAQSWLIAQLSGQ